MLTAHRLRRTWHREVDRFIALSEFSRQKFIAAGLPTSRIAVKPNFVSADVHVKHEVGDYMLFVGRLVDYKGIEVIVKAWEQLAMPVPLRIIGDGPAAPIVNDAAAKNRAIQYLGYLSRPEIFTHLLNARAMLFPSLLYENFPLSVIEAFASGVPVIASRLGAPAEIVEDSRTGLHVRPGDAADLAAKVEWAWTHPSQFAAMGQQAHQSFKDNYSAERNYELLMAIYHAAISENRTSLDISSGTEPATGAVA
jgi:glycosyltransferase involved in cell wall biosynthesis